jgi:predicted ATP-grasp superfamily ATP-dependent carboligase
VHYVASEPELLQLYQQKSYLRYPSLVQERVVGAGMGLFGLFNHGELLTTFGHRRLREKPPSGGVSVLRESIAVHPDLIDQAVSLLSPLGWHGVAMLEYKLNERTAQPVLMEVNGRFWGSLDLAIASGMDFPHLLYKVALGDDFEVPNAYRVGVKSRWLLGDLDHLLMRLTRKDQELNLPQGFPSRIKTFLQFLKFYEPELHYEVLSLSDLCPFIYELRQYLAQLHKPKGKLNG